MVERIVQEQFEAWVRELEDPRLPANLEAELEAVQAYKAELYPEDEWRLLLTDRKIAYLLGRLTPTEEPEAPNDPDVEDELELGGFGD